MMVSACLAKEKCKYNGGYNTHPEILRLVDEGRAITICPELLGGLPVPREPAEILGGDGFDVLNGAARVITGTGGDLTGNFVSGAFNVLEIARDNNVRVAILKYRSPSCGNAVIYDGTFSGRTKQGMGVTAALLSREGIKVYSELDLSNHIRSGG